MRLTFCRAAEVLQAGGHPHTSIGNSQDASFLQVNQVKLFTRKLDLQKNQPGVQEMARDLSITFQNDQIVVLSYCTKTAFLLQLFLLK